MSLCDQLYRPPFEGAESGNRPHYQQERSAKLFRLSGSQALRRRVQVWRALTTAYVSAGAKWHVPAERHMRGCDLRDFAWYRDWLRRAEENTVELQSLMRN